MASPSLFFTIIFFSWWLCGKTFGEKNCKKRNGDTTTLQELGL